MACYGAWYPHSQFWKDFLDEEEGWEGSVYSPQACCLRFLCGVLFCFFAPLWCCKAILFFLFWPCICGIRALKEGNCNKTYFRFQHSKQARYEQRRSQPLAYIESQPTHPVSNVIAYWEDSAILSGERKYYIARDLLLVMAAILCITEAITVYTACVKSCSTHHFTSTH